MAIIANIALKHFAVVNKAEHHPAGLGAPPKVHHE